MRESSPAEDPGRPGRKLFRGRGFYVYATLALVVGVLALVPLRNSSLISGNNGSVGNSAPPLAHTYDNAFRLAREEYAKDKTAVPGAFSLFLTHRARTPRAVILLHGLTNSPRQFKPFAERLYAEGYNVWVPRLPHHGEGDAKKLELMTAEELRALGETSVEIGRGLGDTLIVVGLSAGGTLAAWIAQNEDVDRAVIIAPAFEIAAVPSALAKPLVGLAVRAPDVTHREAKDTGALDREPGWTTRGIGHMLRLGDAVTEVSREHRAAARDVVFLLNANDRTIKARPVLDLASRWASRGTPVKVWELPASLHLAHDVIDPREKGSDTASVYPVLDALVGGRGTGPWLRAVPVP
jgi:esterase/lipase